MKIDRIAKYSADYKHYLFCTGTYYCTVPIDFDFAINCPDMDEKVYYKKWDADRIRDRLNRLGVFLLIWYDLQSDEILKVAVRFDAGCMVEYERQQDIETIFDNLIAYKEKESMENEEFAGEQSEPKQKK